MPVPVIFSDFFNRPDAANLGGNWTLGPAGCWTVAAANGTSVINGGYAQYKGVVPPDCWVDAIESNTAGAWGVIARATVSFDDAGTHYRADLSGTTLDLRKRVGGSLSTLASVSVTRAVGASLILSCVGTRIQVLYGVQPVVVIDVTDSAVAGASQTGTTGLWNGSTTAVTLSRFDARADEILTYVPTGFKPQPEFFTEVTDYKYSGFQQRNQIWTTPRTTFDLEWDYLVHTDYAILDDFFKRRRGRAQSFLIRNPNIYLQNPVGRQFAIADGVSTIYRLDCDRVSSAVTYTDGVADSGVVCLNTGVVYYPTAPYAGAVLTFDATDAYYRMFFAVDKAPWQAEVADRFTFKISAMQDKSLSDGIAI